MIEPGDQPRVIAAPRAVAAKIAIAERAGESDLAAAWENV